MTSRTVLMGTGWVLNLILAEWVISKGLVDPARGARTLAPQLSP